MSVLHTRFQSKVDDIVRLAAYHFKSLNPEAREECIQNTLALAWKYFLGLVEQGKGDDDTVFMSMIGFAITHTRAGRLPQGTGGGRKPKDVLDYACRGMRGVKLEGFDPNFYVGVQATVPDQAAFRIDTPAFLASLSERNRGIALDLANGMGTGETATKWQVSPAAISQFRERFAQLWYQYHGEA